MNELLSPELALVDPDLAARARAALPDPGSFARRARPAAASVAPAAPARAERVRYPFWARVTAALWLLVIGILIGGAAIPHAQDAPRVLAPAEDPTSICKPPPTTTTPLVPGLGSPLRPGP